MPQKWPKIVWNGYTNAPNEAQNTNAKCPDQKQWNIDKILGAIAKQIAKMAKKYLLGKKITKITKTN